MWSSSGEDQQHNNNNNGTRLSSRDSSLSSSSSSPYSDHPRPTTPAPRTMEEVWKDINLSSLHDQPSSRDINHPRFQGMILQDFLARPFHDHGHGHHKNNKDQSHQLTPPTTIPPPPATMLTLNSATDFHLLGNHDLLELNKQNPILVPPEHISNAGGGCSPVNLPFDVFNTCAPSPPINVNGKKRCPEPNVNNSTDRRHKRMIKNRESAARSRARKQAYTNELEFSVAILQKENARLKEQQRQLFIASASDQLAKKNTLQRTFTAPF